MKIQIEDTQLHFSVYPENWPMELKLDYQNKTNGLQDTVAEVNDHSDLIEALKKSDEEQDKRIEALGEAIKNANALANRALALSESNEQKLAQHTEAITTNAQSIAANGQAITNHIGTESTHGATGNIVGTQDYCQPTSGGVVNLAAHIADINQVSITLQNAPADYDQTHAQSVVDAVKTLGAAHNELVTKVNAILAGQQNAKQMAASTQVTE
ncbi:hypothetical protein [Vibrio sp. SCSIO 43136]|uniref:hypothetical protein n=1 Tax=Vibrio sp. SCSIO 43136 TaxID=2819101 RepID=UPI0020757FB4|nr:hypothetical protein [Vibrio sp. SCSIO 43136]USD64210.1 hypothetical protein J4N39_08810 [Vibrio sp. SCSIO 43136]